MYQPSNDQYSKQIPTGHGWWSSGDTKPSVLLMAPISAMATNFVRSHLIKNGRKISGRTTQAQVDQVFKTQTTAAKLAGLRIHCYPASRIYEHKARNRITSGKADV
jgi:hypothetical protein